jgi:hypothetical protein
MNPMKGILRKVEKILVKIDDEDAAVSVNIHPRLKSDEMENVSDHKRHSKQ